MRDMNLRHMDPGGLNYDMFSHGDLSNIVLQRSEILHDIEKYGQIIKAWENGDSTRLDAVVTEKSHILAERAARVIRDEFDALAPHLDALAPKSIADIGCGYAFFDLYAQAAYDCDLLLVDIEQNERRQFGFGDEGAAYASLAKARAFLTGNGVAPQRIRTWNPQNEELEQAEPVDLAVSLLSCGFHYPVDMYMPFFRHGVKKGGAILLDLRARQAKQIEETLSPLGRIETVGTGRRRKRIILHKGPPA